jgi:uncharacterized protein YlbG (UPF0298 family)
MFPKRQGIIVWLHSLKQSKHLRKFGNIHYISKRLKYVVLYCNMEEVDVIMKKIAALPFVKQVQPSYRPFLKMEFESKGDKEKEQHYKLGYSAE